jgi:hypothetical protein
VFDSANSFRKEPFRRGHRIGLFIIDALCRFRFHPVASFGRRQFRVPHFLLSLAYRKGFRSRFFINPLVGGKE